MAVWSCLCSLHYRQHGASRARGIPALPVRLLDAGAIEIGWCNFKTDHSPSLILQLRDSLERSRCLSLGQQEVQARQGRPACPLVSWKKGQPCSHNSGKKLKASHSAFAHRALTDWDAGLALAYAEGTVHISCHFIPDVCWIWHALRLVIEGWLLNSLFLKQYLENTNRAS